MKEYSDWPTFPQLFIRASSSGGADPSCARCTRTASSEKKLVISSRRRRPPTSPSLPRAPPKRVRGAQEDGQPRRRGSTGLDGSPPGSEHQLDIGPKDAAHLTVETGGPSPSQLEVCAERGSFGRRRGDRLRRPGYRRAGLQDLRPTRPPATVRRFEPQGAQGAARQRQDHRCSSTVRTDKESRRSRRSRAPGCSNDAAMAETEKLPKDTHIALHLSPRQPQPRRGGSTSSRKASRTSTTSRAGIDAWSQRSRSEPPALLAAP